MRTAYSVSDVIAKERGDCGNLKPYVVKTVYLLRRKLSKRIGSSQTNPKGVDKKPDDAHPSPLARRYSSFLYPLYPFDRNY